MKTHSLQIENKYEKDKFKYPVGRLIFAVLALLAAVVFGCLKIWWSFGIALTLTLVLWFGCYLENLYWRLSQRLNKLENLINGYSKEAIDDNGEHK